MDRNQYPLCPGCGQTLEQACSHGLCPRCLLARAAFATEGPGSGPYDVPDLEAVTAAFPQLEILELIGRGGMGIVYRARQISLNRVVALKLLLPGRAQDPAFASRFATEARALATLNHPNIVTVHDFGYAQGDKGNPGSGFYFLLMEYVDGVNLRQAMKAGRFTPAQALAVVPPVCAALQFAHDRGIVHRDIKPENLLLDRQGKIKIADFGIAKILNPTPATAPGAVLEFSGEPAVSSDTRQTSAGTPGYMAPEQLTSPQRIDSRADIYSLGVVLYELLTGELPGSLPVAPSQKVQIDVRLDGIVLRALAVHPELRYSTAADFNTQVVTVAAATSTSRASEHPGRGPAGIIKSGRGMLTMAEALQTIGGQFLFHRTFGQILLDDRQLTHSFTGGTTIIPLGSIRNVSVSRFPRSMNPCGVDFLKLTFLEADRLKEALLIPAEGWFALPSTRNQLVADWRSAIRQAVRQVTGAEPDESPTSELAMPDSYRPRLLMIGIASVVPAIIFTAILTGSQPHAPATGLRWLAPTAVLFGWVFGLFAINWFSRRLWSGSAPGKGVKGRIVGVVMFLFMLFLAQWFRPVRSSPEGWTFDATRWFKPPVPVITELSFAPDHVEANVVFADIRIHVRDNPVELRASLRGKPDRTSGANAASSAPVVSVETFEGNRPWRIAPMGTSSWRVGFAFANNALAQDMFSKMKSARWEGVQIGGEFPLFLEHSENGEEFSGRISLDSIVTMGHPAWVEVLGRSSWNENAHQVSWTFNATYSGGVLISLGTNVEHIAFQARRHSPEFLPVLQVKLEPDSNSETRVTILTAAGEKVMKISGRFSGISHEVHGSALFSLKSRRSERMRLARIGEQDLTAQVIESPAQLNETSTGMAFHQRWIRLAWTGGFLFAGLAFLGWEKGIASRTRVMLGLLSACSFLIWGIDILKQGSNMELQPDPMPVERKSQPDPSKL